jgi:hypothetical protein
MKWFEEIMAREQFQEDLRSEQTQAADRVMSALRELGPRYFIDAPVSREKKIMSVESALKNFREREMYEECSYLKSILDSLGRNEDGSHKM